MKAAMMIDVNKVEAVNDLPEPEFKEGVLVKVKMIKIIYYYQEILK